MHLCPMEHSVITVSDCSQKKLSACSLYVFVSAFRSPLGDDPPVRLKDSAFILSLLEMKFQSR